MMTSRPPFHRDLPGFLLAGLLLTLAAAAAAQGVPEAGGTEAGGLARLVGESRRKPGRSGWVPLEPCPRGVDLPAVMTSDGRRLLLATGHRLERYAPDADRWDPRPLTVPARVAPGAFLLADGAGGAFLLPGGGTRLLLHLAAGDQGLRRQPDLPRRVLRGAALARTGATLWFAPGGGSRELFSAPSPGGPWTACEPVGGKVSIPGLGGDGGGLAASGASLFGWGDHHLQHLDSRSRRWDAKTFHAIGFRPHHDGGGCAVDPRTGAMIFLQGRCSRALLGFHPPLMRHWFLKPRLPWPVSGEGARIALAPVGKSMHLFVHLALPTPRLLRIPLSRLVPIDTRSPAADTGTTWLRVPTRGGGMGIRRRHGSSEAFGVVGVLGSLRDELFLMRLRNVRRVDPDTGAASFYPGYHLGETVRAGACAAVDGSGRLLLLPGGRACLRWSPPAGALATSQPSSRTAGLERLVSLPAPLGRGAACTVDTDGALVVVRGGGTREAWRLPRAGNAWQTLPALPAGVPAPGTVGAGLVSWRADLHALVGARHLVLEKSAWRERGTLPFTLTWDGGMVALDAAPGNVYLVRGGISTRLARLRLATGAVQELGPRLPDAVSAEGDRLCVLGTGPRRRLVIHRGHDANEIWTHAVDGLFPIRER